MQVKERRPKGRLGRMIFHTIHRSLRPAVASVGRLNRLGWMA
jgi:hypothetical protein